jgi:hypothetical protein
MRNAGGSRSGSVYPQDRAVGAHDPVADKRRDEMARGSSWNILGAVCLWVQLRRVARRIFLRADEMNGKSMLLIGWLTVVVVLSQAAPLSRIAYNPQAVEIGNSQVTMYRSFPLDTLGLPRPNLSYIETVKPLTQAHNGGQRCADAGGPFRYTRADPVGEWSIAWASDCISDPVGYQWTAQWTWHIGRIRLGPVSFSHTVLRSAEAG